nr:uncharacterized protein LOC109184755 [Ipomoea trifida]
MSTSDISNLCANLTLADVDDEDISMQIPNVLVTPSDGDGCFYAVCRVVGFRSGVVVSAIGSFLGTLVCTDEKNFDGGMRNFYQVHVALDFSKPLKKQIKLKRENGTWVLIDFRLQRLPTFCFLCGVIRHGDRVCPKIIHGVHQNAEKQFGAWLRAGGRRAAPTSG